MLTQKFAKLKWWQVALLAVVVSAIGGLTSMQSDKKDKKLYNNDLKQAPWAPPGWLFGPAWTFNNVFLLLALQRLVRNNGNTNNKDLLRLQAGIWFIFFTFGYIYFNRRSPVLAAVWTVSDAALAAVSFGKAWRPDRKLALYYMPLLVWTSFASTIAVYQALENNDPVLHTGALVD